MQNGISFSGIGMERRLVVGFTMEEKEFEVFVDRFQVRDVRLPRPWLHRPHALALPLLDTRARRCIPSSLVLPSPCLDSRLRHHRLASDPQPRCTPRLSHVMVTCLSSLGLVRIRSDSLSNRSSSVVKRSSNRTEPIGSSNGKEGRREGGGSKARRSTMEADGDTCGSTSGERWTREEEEALLHLLPTDGRDKDVMDRVRWAIHFSLAVNVVLFFVKLAVAVLSRSLAIVASLVDSFVDLCSQMVIAIAENRMRTLDPRFPIGKARLETVGIIVCASIMSMSALEVIQQSVIQIVDGVHGNLPKLNLDIVTYAVLGVAIGLKLALYFYCSALKAYSPSAMALAEDHRNDVLSNLVAIITASVAHYDPQRLWYVDPVGALAISLFIVTSWFCIAKEQIDHIVGKGAEPEFIEQVTSMANSHHEFLFMDVIRAYHFGDRFLVEIEVVLPREMTVEESHDIALSLQHKVEAMEEVERAFVHVDYQQRIEPEHKVERTLLRHTSSARSSEQEGKI